MSLYLVRTDFTNFTIYINEDVDLELHLTDHGETKKKKKSLRNVPKMNTTINLNPELRTTHKELN